MVHNRRNKKGGKQFKGSEIFFYITIHTYTDKCIGQHIKVSQKAIPGCQSQKQCDVTMVHNRQNKKGGKPFKGSELFVYLTIHALTIR